MTRRDDAGFSLTELVVAVGLILLVVLTIGRTLDLGLKVTNRVDSATTAQREGRLVLDALAREARVRSSIVAPASPVVSPDPGPHALTFTTLADPAGGVPGRTIHYDVSAGKLYKRVDLGPRAVVLQKVLNDNSKPLFTYYNAAGIAISTGVPASTRRIAVRLEVDTGGAPLVLSTEVTFRNPS